MNFVLAAAAPVFDSAVIHPGVYHIEVKRWKRALVGTQYGLQLECRPLTKRNNHALQLTISHEGKVQRAILQINRKWPIVDVIHFLKEPITTNGSADKKTYGDQHPHNISRPLGGKRKRRPKRKRGKGDSRNGRGRRQRRETPPGEPTVRF